MNADAMMMMAFLAFVVAMCGACKGRKEVVLIGIPVGTIYAILSIWSFTWGQG